jgi:glycosyltransferase involved in cell wall biosynthesis
MLANLAGGASLRTLSIPLSAVNRISELAKHRVIANYSEFCVLPCARRALLSYLVLPLLPPPVLRDHVMFSNHGIAQEIPRVLNELGFTVDIVSYDNRSWLPAREYDLFIGHAGINFERISRRLAQVVPRIYFSTGTYWRELNVQEARRLYDLALRRGYLLPPDRFVRYEEEYANCTADGIICLGNQEAAGAYARFRKVVCINNAIFPVDWKGFAAKDFSEGRKHFLFFSGRGSIHKGLDRLLEAFVGLDAHLYVCQHMESDFIRIYRHELSETPNIHLLGFVKMRSPQFEQLAARCNWVILPTCAEGQPGSVLECMGYGLIPILPDAAHIDLEDWGVRLPDVDVGTIRSVAEQASQIPAEECQRRAERVLAATRDAYSVEQFRANFRAAVSTILAAHESV